MKTNFHNANDAFNYFYIKIKSDGVDFGDTKALFNIGFTPLVIVKIMIM